MLVEKKHQQVPLQTALPSDIKCVPLEDMGESDIIFMGSSTVSGHRRCSYNTDAVFRNALISFVNSPVFRNKTFELWTEWSRYCHR